MIVCKRKFKPSFALCPLSHFLTVHHHTIAYVSLPFYSSPTPHFLADTLLMKYINHSVWSDLFDASKSFSKRSSGIIMRKGGEYVYTLVPTTNSLIPLSPSHNPESTQNLYPQIRITDTPRNSSPISFIERFIVRCEKMIFIVRMIVNVRTLWLSLIQLRLWYFVATFSAVYNRRISNLHDPSGATRYVFRYFFFIAKEKMIHQGKLESAQANVGQTRLFASDVRVAENNSQLLRIPVLFIIACNWIKFGK